MNTALLSLWRIAHAFLLRKEKPAGRRANQRSHMNTIASLFESRNSAKDKGSTAYVVNKMCRDAEGGVVMIPPGIAAKILEEINFPDQRKLKSARRRDHVARIMSYTWIDGASTLSFAITPDGQMWLVDGQHRLSAIVQCDRKVGVKLNIIQAQDFDDVRRIYATFDQKASVRNTSELIDSSGIAKKTGLKRKVVRAIYNAAPIISNDMEPVPSMAGSTGVRTHDSRLDVVTSWQPEAMTFQAILDAAQSSLSRKLARAGTASVCLYTLRHQPEKAYEFWMGLAMNDGLRRNDPRNTLIEDFMARTLTSGSSRQSVQQSSIAWNAFYENRTLKFVRCMDNKPIYILGTPLAKRRN